MVMQTGTINDTGTVEFENLTRYEHHKIDLIVSNYTEPIYVRIEDISNNESIPINLDSLERTFLINKNGAESYLIENLRLEKIKVNVVDGVGTILCNYEGW